MNAKTKEGFKMWSINLVTSAAIVFFAFKLDKDWFVKKQFEKTLDSKADKIELEKKADKIYVDNYIEGHSYFHESEKESSTQFIELIKEMFEKQNKAIDTRINDLKEYLKK